MALRVIASHYEVKRAIYSYGLFKGLCHIYVSYTYNGMEAKVTKPNFLNLSNTIVKRCNSGMFGEQKSSSTNSVFRKLSLMPSCLLFCCPILRGSTVPALSSNLTEFVTET